VFNSGGWKLMPLKRLGLYLSMSKKQYRRQVNGITQTVPFFFWDTVKTIQEITIS